MNRGLKELSWSRKDRLLGRERYPVPFSIAHKLGTYDIERFTADVTSFANKRGDVKAIGVALLWSLPLAEGHGEPLRQAENLLLALKLPVDARRTANHLLMRIVQSEDEGGRPLREARLQVGSTSLFARYSISGGPGGHVGYVLLQFVDPRAEPLNWPTVQEVKQLQPMDRWLIEDGNSDIPAMSPKDVVNLTCRPSGRAMWRCRYILTVDDWVGPGRPETRYSDLFARDREGKWRMAGKPRLSPGG